MNIRSVISIARLLIVLMLTTLALLSPLHAEEDAAGDEQGTIFTFWPLIDYRESPRGGFSNLSLLGPLIKVQKNGNDSSVALRPLFFRNGNEKNQTAETDYLYPLAATDTTPEVTRFQILKLIQKNVYRKNEPGKQEDSMFFPFYISGTSEKYGPYTAVVPFYGDIYERFWRDEYHFVLFPLYGRTVNKGTTTRNFLYPFFSTVSGEKESGFQFWPLYGQSSKEGVYNRQFALWPFFMREERGLDTDSPTKKLQLLPLYAASDSPKRTVRYYLWPFFGYRDDQAAKEREIDYLWPFWWTVRGAERNATSVLPFYSVDERKNSTKHWYMWPLYQSEIASSADFCEERDRILYFLFSDKLESWPKDGKQRRRAALWPLLLFNRDAEGVKTLTMPAPVEPILDREGIERNWAPFWRIYYQKWNDHGDSAVSFLWNLYWHEARGNELAYEIFPLITYRSTAKNNDVSLLKGLIRYQNRLGMKKLCLLWLPFGFQWGDATQVTEEKASGTKGSIK